MTKKQSKIGALGAPDKGTHMSVAAMALEVSSTHETITKRIADAKLQPSGQRRGFPVYRLKDLLRAINQTTDGKLDPEKLPPFERQAHFKAEIAKLNFERELARLIPAGKVEHGYAHIFKTVARVFDTLPDTLERDCGLTPATLAVVERHLYAARLELHLELNTGLGNDDATESGELGSTVDLPEETR